MTTTRRDATFDDATHALATGFLLGHLRSHGVDAHPIRVAGTGDYTPGIRIDLPVVDDQALPISCVFVTVQP